MIDLKFLQTNIHTTHLRGWRWGKYGGLGLSIHSEIS